MCVINVYSFLYETNIQNRKYLYFKLLVLTTLTKQFKTKINVQQFDV